MSEPADFQPHPDGKRFHVRTYNGGMYQVYARDLEHVCDCTRVEMADMVADALEENERLRAIEAAAREYHCAAQNLMDVASGYDCDDDEFEELENTLVAKSSKLRELLEKP